MACLPWLFRTVLESITKKYHNCRHYFIWDISDDFFFILIMECRVYSLESPQRGNSNENTQHTFMLKKNRKDIPIILAL